MTGQPPADDAEPLSLRVLLRLAGPLWVAHVALRRLRREWRRLTAPRAPGPYPPARKRRFDGQRPRFFVTPENRARRAGLVKSHCPGARERTLAAAGEALAHRFDLLGSGPTDLGPTIDWHADFRIGYRWPLEHHLRLTGPPLGSGPDIKVPWELSRCHHFLTLGKAYAFTGDERYAQEFVAQVESWLAANPPGFGVNWANTMEVAIRAVNWLWAYHFFAGADALTPEFEAAFLDSMDAHGRTIIRNLETYWPPTNHLIANYCGLVYLGVMLPQLREARRWLRRGQRGLMRALETQVYADGVADEGSTGYHRLVTELILSPVLLLQLNGLPVPGAALARIEKMLSVMRASTTPQGTDPILGDADDGRLHGPANPAHLLAIGAVFFAQPDVGGTVGNQWEDALWLFGERAVEAKEAAGAAGQVGSACFPDGGLVFMRHNDLYLSLDAGPHGHRGNGGHAHNDTLSITLSAFGRRFLVDPGTYAYTGDVEARNHFRSTGAHNTLQVDGAEMNRFVPSELFRLNHDATPTIHRWQSGTDYALLDASHDGYARLPGRMIHRRQLLFDKQAGFWLLWDIVTGEGQHELAWPYHFDLLTVEQGPEQAAIARAEDGTGLLILSLEPNSLELTLSEDWISPSYGVKHRAPLAKYTRRAILPATCTFVLYPYQADHPPLDHARHVGQRALAQLDALLSDETSSV